jgi:hypothetical protein
MATEQQNVIWLRHGDQQELWVETENQDRFLTTVEAVVRACQAYGHIAEVGKQLRKLLRKLDQWLTAHPEDVQEAYLTIRDSGLLFLVVRKTKAFNHVLEEALTDLDIEIANDEVFNLIRLSVLALPATSQDCIKSFLPVAPSEVGDAERD